MLRTRLLSNSGESIVPDINSVHHMFDPEKIHPVLTHMFEVADQFHSWINETEDTPTNLHMKSYLQNGIPLDDAQMRHRASIVPMTHPALYGNYYTGLNSEHKSIVKSYSEIGLKHGIYPSGSARINQHLIGASKANMLPSPMIQHLPYGEEFDISAMDSALVTNKLPHDLTTYSGIGFDPSTSHNKSGVFNSPAYMSSSTRRFVSAKYAIQSTGNIHHILQINNKTGNSGIYTGNRSELSKFSDDEFILSRNIRLKVDSIPTTMTTSGHTFKIWNTSRLDNIYQG